VDHAVARSVRVVEVEETKLLQQLKSLTDPLRGRIGDQRQDFRLQVMLISAEAPLVIHDCAAYAK